MIDCVCLASGGLDSLVCMRLLQSNDISFLPLYVDFGQLARKREIDSLRLACRQFGFPAPLKMKVKGFGSLIRTGLTDPNLRVNEDAFTPNRNLLFLTLATSVGFQKGCRNVVVGFLDEKSAIFPDQTDDFLRAAEAAISASLGSAIEVFCPLRNLTKRDVVKLASELGVAHYYSCHLGSDEPCGRCIACLEYGE